jgi:hypothetical protein
MDLSATAIRALLFAMFAMGTAAISAVIAPTYDHLLVPELAQGALYPTLTATGGSGFLGTAASFSSYVLTDLVDPAIAVVALAVGGLYLLRAFVGRTRMALGGWLSRLVVAVLVANLTVPIAGGILGLAGATYPVLAGFDGGAWQNWTSIGGLGMFSYSWDNGILAFIIAFVLFSLVLLLAAAIAIRNALLGVLLVLLPIFTLLWPIPYFAPLARRAWSWFLELAFLPCVVVIPLELAVGSSSILLTMGYLVVALAAPSLLSLTGSSLLSAGFPSASGAVTGGIQRGLLAASVVVESAVRPNAAVLKAAGAGEKLTGAVQRAAGQPALLAMPAFSGELLGHGSARLFGHLATQMGLSPRSSTRSGGSSSSRGPRWSAPPVRGYAS